LLNFTVNFNFVSICWFVYIYPYLSINSKNKLIFEFKADSLSSLDKNIAEKWSKYLTLKSRFYKAQAYCYFGQDLLGQDKCGEAIKCLQESLKLYDETKNICQIYANLKGAGTQAVPERHQFFKNLGANIARIAEKCDRENGMMYIKDSFEFY